MVKKNNAILILGIIGIVFLLFYVMPQLSNESNIQLGVDLFDKNGNKISTPDYFAIVNGVPEVNQIALRTKVTNTGDVSLRCFISEGSGSGSTEAKAHFFEAIRTIDNQNQIISKGNFYEWITPRFDIEDYASDTYTTEFSVGVCCYRELTDEKVGCDNGHLFLEIRKEQAGFSVEVTQN